MDLHGIRTLNLVATILFGIVSVIIPMIYFPVFGFMFFMSGNSLLSSVCFVILLVWIIGMILLTYYMFTNTVRTIDNGEYDIAKRWTLYAAIKGFIFGLGSVGIIVLILFIISYVSFDEAIRRQFYLQTYGYYPQPYYPPPAYYPPPSYYPPPYYYPPPPTPPPQNSPPPHITNTPTTQNRKTSNDYVTLEYPYGRDKPVRYSTKTNVPDRISETKRM